VGGAEQHPQAEHRETFQRQRHPLSNTWSSCPRRLSCSPLRDTQKTRPQPFTPPAIFSNFSGRGVRCPAGAAALQ
jgi:hypothetical protein